MGADRILDALPELSRKQFLTIRAAVTGDEDLTLLTGAARSGKTVASLIWWLLYVDQASVRGELLMMGRTRHSLARNVFGAGGYANTELFGDLTKEISYTPGAPTAKILGRTVHVFGAADSRSAPTILGLTGAGGYIDELTVMDEEAFNQFSTRMSVAGSRIIATTNPDGQYHWVKKSIIDRRTLLGARVRQFTPLDNPHPDIAEWVIKMERMFPPGTMWHSRYILGKWVAAEGAIYTVFDPETQVLPQLSLPPMLDWVSDGMDYGSSAAGNTRGLRIGIAPHPTEDGYALYVCGEWAPERDADIILSASYRKWSAGFAGEPAYKYLDTNAGSLAMQLTNDGVGGVVTPDKSVNPGIQLVMSLLAAGRLFISDSCEELLKEFPSYRWDPAAAKRGEDKPIKVNDHSLDALRYALFSSRRIWGKYIPMIVTPESDMDEAA